MIETDELMCAEWAYLKDGVAYLSDQQRRLLHSANKISPRGLFLNDNVSKTIWRTVLNEFSSRSIIVEVAEDKAQLNESVIYIAIPIHEISDISLDNFMEYMSSKIIAELTEQLKRVYRMNVDVNTWLLGHFNGIYVRYFIEHGPGPWGSTGSPDQLWIVRCFYTLREKEKNT